MAVDKKKLEKLKQRVDKFRQKHAHTGKEAKGVSKPHRPAKQIKTVGKRGGVYQQTTSGAKHYTKSLVKGKVKEWLIDTFVQEARMSKEEIKKAVTSEAASAEGKPPVDEAIANGENKPAIQDAKTPDEIQAEAAAAAPVTPPAEAAPVKKEISFDGLFANDYSLGSTLKQNPNGGNTMSNVKKPAIDYVERAKNHKNQSMTSEQLSQVKQEVKANKK